MNASIRQSLWLALTDCSEKSLGALLAPFIPHFQSAIESAVTKPAFRGDVAAALTVLSNLSISKSVAATALKAVCGQVFKRSGFFG